ncbi:hypothetical protein V8B97DRAFT_1071927 [Scleroderma yunnanense]
MNPALPINRPCTLCHTPTSMWCSRCQNAWYCTPEHLQSDWPRHRLECVSVTCAQNRSTIAISQPAAPNVTVLPATHWINLCAILYAPEEEWPRIITVQCRQQVPSDDSFPQLLMNFPDGQPASVILMQGLDGRQLHCPLHLWYSPTALSRHAPLNRPIGCTVGSTYYGMVVVLKFSGPQMQDYFHATLDDVLDISAYFSAYK